MEKQLWGRLKERWNEFSETLICELFVSALFVASLVLLCERALVPIEMPARVIVGQLAAQDAAQARTAQPTLAVLKLDRETFQKDFGGRQPLDRCKLIKHLQHLLSVRPDLRQLGLDLDLSETGNAELDRCARDVIEFLGAQHERGLRTVLILPVDEEDRRASRRWRERVRAANLAMADPRVVREFGVVRRHWLNKGSCPTLGQALADPPPAVEAACYDPTKDLDELDSQPHASMYERNIAFHALVRDAWVPGLQDDGKLQRLTDQIEALGARPSVRRVILGAHFDASDDQLTPIGTLAGVEVHAAVAMNPDEPISHRWGFAVDVLLGVVFGWAVHWIWTAYFDQRLGRGHAPPTEWGVKLAYLWPSGLLMTWILLVTLGLPAMSLFTLHTFGVWINPVPMLVGMSVDAFVIGSVNSAITHAGHAIEPAPGPRMSPGRRALAKSLAGLPWGVWWAVFLFAIAQLIWHQSPLHLLERMASIFHGSAG